MIAQESHPIIDHIIEKHPKFIRKRSVNPTAYSAFDGNLWADRMEQICLGQLGYNPLKNTQVFCIYNHFDEVDPEPFRAWFDWILSDETSPWREIVSRQPQQDREFIFRHGYYLTSLDFPSNYVVNFLTAFRMAWEKPDMTYLWWELVKGGASPGAAYSVLAFIHRHGNYSHIDTNDRDSYKKAMFWTLFPMGIQGHQALSPNVADMSLPYRLNNALPFRKCFSRHNFSYSSVNLPVNLIWTGRREANVDEEFSTCLFTFLKTGALNKEPVENKFKRTFSIGEPPKVNPYGANPIRAGVSQVSTKQLLEFCLYVDKLQPHKDFNITE